MCVADEYDEMLLARKLGNLVSPLDIYKPCVDKHSRQSSPMTSKTSREDDPSWASPLFCHTQGGQSRERGSRAQAYLAGSGAKKMSPHGLALFLT